MRHRKSGRKLGLPSDQRRALLKSLTRALILNDRIVTTETRAKELRPIVEKLVTIARRGGTGAPIIDRINTRRLVRKWMDSNIDEFVRVPGGPKGGMKIARNPYYAAPRLFEVIAPRYMDRPGGYTRITRVNFRRGDAAPMVLIEFVDGDEVEAIPEPEVAATAKGRTGLFGLGRRHK